MPPNFAALERYLAERSVDLEEEINALLLFIDTKKAQRDWSAVAGGAVDLRVAEAELITLEEVATLLVGKSLP